MPDRPANNDPRTPSVPRRVRNGLRLRRKDAPPAETELAQQLLRLVEHGADADALREGLEFARLGQIISLEILGAPDPKARALVQDAAAKPLDVSIALPPLGPQQWDAVIHNMAGEARYVAKLLAGEMPHGFDDLLDSLGLKMIPDSAEVLRRECTCRHAQPCRHVLAAAYLLAQQLDDQPLLILSLAGMPAERVLERVRHARTIHTHGSTAAHGDPRIPESQIAPEPLEDCLDRFWRSGPELAQLEAWPPQQHAPHALLRRLGPPPMGGKFPMVGLLASIYDSVTNHAVGLREGARTAAPDEQR